MVVNNVFGVWIDGVYYELDQDDDDPCILFTWDKNGIVTMNIDEEKAMARLDKYFGERQ